MSELIPIKAFYHKHEAQMAAELLKENGIESMVSSDDCGGYRAHLTLGMGNNRILVKAEDVSQAKTILAALDMPLSEEELTKVEEQAVEEQAQPIYTKRRSTLITAAIWLTVIPALATLSFMVGATFFNKDKRQCRRTNAGYECREYYKGGQLRMLETFSGKNETNVSLYEYYRNGPVWLESHFVNNKLEGLSKEYYENGKLKTETPFKNGSLTGEEKSYFETGELESIALFKNDVLDGITKIYSKSGKLLESLVFQNDILLDGNSKPYNGILKTYFDENGPLRSESNYQNGKLNGPSKYCRENGTIENETTYTKGGLNGKSNDYYPNGKLQRSVIFKNKYRVSIKEFDQSGKLIFLRINLSL